MGRYTCTPRSGAPRIKGQSLKPRHAIILAVAMSPIAIYAAPAKLLDALRYEESKNKSHVINHNRNGTKDIGAYQFNSAYLSEFAWRYNKGEPFNPTNEREARRIASAHIDHLQTSLVGDKIESNYLYHHPMINEAIICWNCGLTRYRKGPPKGSIDFAIRVLQRANYGTK